MKTILFLADFSENSPASLDYAATIARLFQATLLLCSVGRVSAANAAPGAEAVSSPVPNAHLNAALATLPPDLPSEYVTLTTPSQNNLENLVRKRKIHLVVVNASAFGQIQSESVDLLHSLSCPLLLLPDDARLTSFDKIAFAVDLKPPLQAHCIAPLIELASRTHAEVLVLNILGSSGEISPRRAAEGIKLESWLENVPYSLHVLRHTDVAAGIRNFVDVTRADMLALIAHKHSFFEQLFHKSVTKQMATSAPVPVLIMQSTV